MSRPKFAKIFILDNLMSPAGHLEQLGERIGLVQTILKRISRPDKYTTLD